MVTFKYGERELTARFIEGDEPELVVEGVDTEGKTVELVHTTLSYFVGVTTGLMPRDLAEVTG